MQLINIVRKLIGPIKSTGDEIEDMHRRQNLKTMARLVNRLISDIDLVIGDQKKDRPGSKSAKKQTTSQDAELCVVCEDNQVVRRKWKMCLNCYVRLYRNGTLKDHAQYKTEWKKRKISDQCIMDMVNDGFTTADIARICDMSRQGVHSRVDQAEYKAKTMFHNYYEIIFLYKIGFEEKEITELCSVGLPQVRNVLHKYRVKKRK